MSRPKSTTFTAILIFVIAYLTPDTTTAQTTPDSTRALDSSRVQSSVTPSLLAVQFGAGSAAFAIAFWAFGGSKLLHGSDQATLALGPVIALACEGLAVHFATSAMQNSTGAWGAALGGSFLGAIGSALLFPQLYHGHLPTETYIALSGISVAVSLLLYDLTIDKH